MAINYQALSQIDNIGVRFEAVQKAFDAEEYIPITDAILAAQLGNVAGKIVLQLFEAETQRGRINPITKKPDPTNRRTFRLRPLFDEWGDPYKPGDIVEWKAGINKRDRQGRKFTSQKIKELVRTGQEDQYYITHAAEVDADGCIQCAYEDAGSLINLWGIHYDTGLPISKHQEFGALSDYPDGGKRHKRNWRFVEVLPGRESESVPIPKAKRGRKPKNSQA